MRRGLKRVDIAPTDLQKHFRKNEFPRCEGIQTMPLTELGIGTGGFYR